MSKQITLGSLFDGIGGFPLSGAMCGVEPVWASEIEPFPIAVTMNRFPNMKHLGSVTDIKGDQIEPVDIITFGSPCQDLSVAGAQKGIHEGERSSLFFEAVRVIKEMRASDKSTGRTDEHVRPRFAVWENVPGAFSSNKGEDFRAVLQAFTEIADPNVLIPEPPGGWTRAGCIVGKGYSIAWRTYDAQYWGVPQRRKRIYLVADFGGERAGKILFKRESLPRNPQPRKEAREEAAGNAGGSAAGSGQPCGGYSPTVYALQGNGIDRALTAGCNGSGWREKEMYTLNTVDRPAVVFDTTRDRHAVVYEPKSAMEENWDKSDVKNALRASASKSSHAVVEPAPTAFHLQQDPISSARLRAARSRIAPYGRIAP